MKITDNIYFRNFDDAVAYIRAQKEQLTDPDKAVEVCLGSGWVIDHTEYFVYFRVG